MTQTLERFPVELTHLQDVAERMASGARLGAVS